MTYKEVADKSYLIFCKGGQKCERGFWAVPQGQDLEVVVCDVTHRADEGKIQ